MSDDAQPRGRELDALIHLHVFRHSTQSACPLCPQGFYLDPANRCHHVPPYSSDIRVAWKVVERCTTIGPFGFRQVNGLPVATWFMGHFEAAHIWACSASEAAEAICRAALSAVEGQPASRPTGGQP